MKELLEAIASAIKNNYETNLVRCLRTKANLVIQGFDERIYDVLTLCKNNGWKVTHVCIPNYMRLELGTTDIEIVTVDDVYAMGGNTTVLVASDAYLAVSFINLFRQHGVHNAIIFPPINNCTEDEKKIVSNLPEVWNAYNLLTDEVSKETFLSLLKYKITGDLSMVIKSEFPQYFQDAVRPVPDDRIIDGGAFDGETGISFLRAVAGNAKVIGFEPNKENFTAAKVRIQESGFENRYTLLNEGLGSFSSKAYVGGQGAGSFILEKETVNSQAVQIRSIDEYCKDSMEKISLIKLDIEGYELAALTGARTTIAKFLPKLQICLYHKTEDLWELPLFINRISGRYSFSLAHHSFDDNNYSFEKYLPTSQRNAAKEYGFYELVTCWESVLYCFPR